MSIVIQPEMEEWLRSRELAWLYTVRPDGRPHSVPVWFFWEGETILIFSRPDTQKTRNLQQNQAVTLALDEARKGVVILEGTAVGYSSLFLESSSCTRSGLSPLRLLGIQL